MKKINIVELFCGSGILTQTFKDKGHATFTVDIRKRKGICEPDLRKNIQLITLQDIPFEKCHVLWASPPCDVWSYASNNFHWDEWGYPKTMKCLESIKLIKKCLELIEQISPDYFFIENPRGRLRYFPPLLEFLRLNGGVINSLTLSRYGFNTTKPTNIFTNAIDWQPLPMDDYGRGAKVLAKLDNMTRCSRQKLPRPLAEEILQYCENKYQVLYETVKPEPSVHDKGGL